MRVFDGRVFVGIVMMLLSTSIPALAVGSSQPYGQGGWFEQFDPIVRQYNQSGEQFLFFCVGQRLVVHAVPRNQERLHRAQCQALVSRRP